MCATIALAQFSAAGDPAVNLETIASYAGQAGFARADLLVLPEYGMGYPKKGGDFPAGQTLDGPFAAGLCALARQHGLYIACGLLERTGGDKLYNTTVLIDRGGHIVRAHRKTHLFCSPSFQESDHFLPGDRLFQPVDTDFGRLGLLVCYEIRFPELARLQVLDGAQLLVVCSAFVAGPGKNAQWHTLLNARAIENGVFVCAADHTKPHVFLGESCAYDPVGTPLGSLGAAEGMLMVRCDVENLDAYRAQNPAILQRRASLYQMKDGRS